MRLEQRCFSRMHIHTHNKHPPQPNAPAGLIYEAFKPSRSSSPHILECGELCLLYCRSRRQRVRYMEPTYREPQTLFLRQNLIPHFRANSEILNCYRTDSLIFTPPNIYIQPQRSYRTKTTDHVEKFQAGKRERRPFSFPSHRSQLSAVHG